MKIKALLDERDWLIPSMILTGSLALAATLLMPSGDYGGLEFFLKFPAWVGVCLLAELLWLFGYTVRLMLDGVADPVAHFRSEFDWRRPLVAGAGTMLAGINLITFMWIKPELNVAAPFWADALIADAEKAIFGIDLWKLFEGVALEAMAVTYNVFWVWALLGTFFWLLMYPPSRQRSASILNYFFLWSVFGPIFQFLMSTAGPIFYARIGLGDRFAGLEANLPELTMTVSDYLWAHYQNQEMGFGTGISAMPSLHIATVAWMAISLRAVGSRWTLPALVFALYMFVASVALGWHYALDGVAGAFGAWLGHILCRRFLAIRTSEIGTRPAVGAV